MTPQEDRGTERRFVMRGHSGAHTGHVAGAGLVASGLTGLALLAMYRSVIRPRHLRWGATADELARRLPGDDRIARPDIAFTRAVTIDAPPAAVWPWIVQMGYRRAGWYSYDRLDNDGIRVRRIIPELQHLEVGDVLPTGPDGGFRVEAIDPGHSLLLAIDPSTIGRAVEMNCLILLEPIGDARTRLLLRLRAVFRGRRERAWGRLLFDAGDFVMMRRMLLGIRERAQAGWAEGAPRMRQAGSDG
jgi:hypothetical protein